MSSIGLVGGTFDFFHVGHQKLISSCLSNCDLLEIWVLSDKIALQKIQEFLLGLIDVI